MHVEVRIQIDKYKTNALLNNAVVSNGDEHYSLDRNQKEPLQTKIC